MIMPSKKGLLYLSKPALHFFHHPFRVVITVVGGRLPTCSQLMSLSQLALVKMQSLHKCVGVSSSLLHSLHSVSCGQPLFAKLSAVKIFFWSRSQAKKRHLGSVLAFQIGWNNDVLVRPMNWIRYALFVVYSPLGVHRQVISSSALVSLACSWITSHNSAYSLISTPVVNGRTRSIQWFPCSAFCTEIFFFLIFEIDVVLNSLVMNHSTNSNARKVLCYPCPLWQSWRYGTNLCLFCHKGSLVLSMAVLRFSIGTKAI